MIMTKKNKKDEKLSEDVVLRGADLNYKRVRELVQAEIGKKGKKYDYVHAFIETEEGKVIHFTLTVSKWGRIYRGGSKRHLSLRYADSLTLVMK
jgi:hypothetical protein